MPTSPTTCSAQRACWLRAWHRAKSEKLIPFRNADRSWSVKSYTITPTGPNWSDFSCTCLAGQQGRICKHQAVVAKAIAIGVSPIRPIAAAAVAAVALIVAEARAEAVDLPPTLAAVRSGLR